MSCEIRVVVPIIALMISSCKQPNLQFLACPREVPDPACAVRGGPCFPCPNFVLLLQPWCSHQQCCISLGSNITNVVFKHDTIRYDTLIMASSAASGLLSRQLKQMQSDKDIPGISCGLVGNNVFEWEVMLMISDDCKFYGGK